MSVSVQQASDADIDVVRQLFKEYVATPTDPLFDSYLTQQDFEREVADLPGEYRPPLGALLLAQHDGAFIGCVALKPLAPPEVCEMKRLFVRPQGRGLGVGRALVDAVVAAARRAGYSKMRLDCLPSMHDAQRLYRACGFYEIAPYNENPVEGSLFFERALMPPADAVHRADHVRSRIPG